MIDPNYFLDKEAQRKAYHAYLLRQYAIWLTLIALVGGAIWLL